MSLRENFPEMGKWIYDSENNIDSRCSYSGAIYMYMTIIVKQVYSYISQISGERLQEQYYRTIGPLALFYYVKRRFIFSRVVTYNGVLL